MKMFGKKKNILFFPLFLLVVFTVIIKAGKHLTLCILGNFACFLSLYFSSAFFSKSMFLKKIQEYHQSVKPFAGPYLAPNCCKCYQQTAQVGLELAIDPLPPGGILYTIIF